MQKYETSHSLKRTRKRLTRIHTQLPPICRR